MTQEMFDLGLPAPKVSHRTEGEHGVKVAEAKPVTWTRVTTVTKPKCDACVAAMVAGGKWKAPDPTRWRRVEATGETFWCYFHGLERKAADGQAEQGDSES